MVLVSSFAVGIIGHVAVADRPPPARPVAAVETGGDPFEPPFALTGAWRRLGMVDPTPPPVVSPEPVEPQRRMAPGETPEVDPATVAPDSAPAARPGADTADPEANFLPMALDAICVLPLLYAAAADPAPSDGPAEMLAASQPRPHAAVGAPPPDTPEHGDETPAAPRLAVSFGPFRNGEKVVAMQGQTEAKGAVPPVELKIMIKPLLVDDEEEEDPPPKARPKPVVAAKPVAATPAPAVGLFTPTSKTFEVSNRDAP
jgi:hypothetical protein